MYASEPNADKDQLDGKYACCYSDPFKNITAP